MRLASANLTATKTSDPPEGFPLAISSAADSAGASKFGSLLLEQISPKSGEAPPSEGQPATTIAGATAAPVRGSASVKLEVASRGNGSLTAEPRATAVPQAVAALAALPQRRGPVQQRSDTPGTLIGASDSPGATEPSPGTEVPPPLPGSGALPVEENARGLDPGSAATFGPQATVEPESGPAAAADSRPESSSPVQRGEQAKPSEGAHAKSRRSESARSAEAAGARAASDLIRTGSLGNSAQSLLTETSAAGDRTPVPVSCGATLCPGEESAARGEGLSLQASGKRQAPALPAGSPPAAGNPPDPSHAAGGVASAPHTTIHESQGGLADPGRQRRSEQPLVEGNPATGAPRAHAEPAVAHSAQTPISSGIIRTIPGDSSVGSVDRGGRPVAAFERMDAVEPPRILETTPQKLTVGVRDSGLGWIEIRTHAVTGQVAATLASSTHEAHAALAAELPAIRDTLMNQHIALQSLSAERFSASTGGGNSASDRSESGDPARASYLKSKADPPSAPNDAEGEELSYISVRV